MKKPLFLLVPVILTGCLSDFSYQAEIDRFVGWQKADLLADISWGEPDEKGTAVDGGKPLEVWSYDDGVSVPNGRVSNWIPAFPMQTVQACRHSFSMDGDKIVKATTTCDD